MLQIWYFAAIASTSVLSKLRFRDFLGRDSSDIEEPESVEELPEREKSGITGAFEEDAAEFWRDFFKDSDLDGLALPLALPLPSG